MTRTKGKKKPIMPKQIKSSIEGKCPYCPKHVQNLEAHIHDKHKGEKLVKK